MADSPSQPDLDRLKARILEESMLLGAIEDLDLISDPGDRLVICRLKPAAPEKKRDFVAKYDGFAIGESVFFKVARHIGD
jgi:hypothetical protein